jgi:hypothetical protein
MDRPPWLWTNSESKYFIINEVWGGLKMTSGHRISTTYNGQNHFKQMAGSKGLDEYYNIYLRK